MNVDIKDKINGFKLIKTVFVYKHPLLNFFKDDENKIYLSCWYDLDENYDKWALLSITGKNLEDYENNKISLFNIFNENKTFLIFDTKYDSFEKNEWNNFLEMELKNFNCLPEKGAYLILNENLNNDK